jgi:feruloyl-CoA synthase
MATPLRELRLGPGDAILEKRADGTMIVRSPHALGVYPERLTERLVHWAGTAPDRVFVGERTRDGDWRTLTYAQTLDLVRRLASAFLARGLSAERPVAVLSGNDIEHLLVYLACAHVGIPFAPVSVAYSLVSSDFGKLKHVFNILTPKLVFSASGATYARAIAAVMPEDAELVVTRDPAPGQPSTAFDDLLKREPGAAVLEAFDAVGPDTIVKFLFTSGSTAMPKAMINTQRMICSNARQIRHAMAFLADEPPVMIDWLPWNHTFGGNHNISIALDNGGTLYIDAGKPVAGPPFESTVRNLREIAPTVYFNVPKGYEMLVARMREDEALRINFFSRLRMLFYAGAALPQHVWDALDELAVQTVGERIFMMTGLGATETAPSALFTTMRASRAGMIGVPVRGCELKLVRNGEKLEARVRGPNVTPGYWRQPELTSAAFDKEGFYKFGDAVKFFDERDPGMGFVFDGRVTEDFKLGTGTWVSVGPLRMAMIAHFAPLLREAVICGHGRDELAAMLLLDPDGCRLIAPELPADAPLRSYAEHPRIRDELAVRLRSFADLSTGSSNRITRVIVLDVPPSIDLGEVTDKGSINQRAVLDCRVHLVAELYRDVPSARTLCAIEQVN